MRTLLKILLVGAALFAAIFVVAFGHGIYLGLTGQVERSETAAETAAVGGAQISERIADPSESNESATASVVGELAASTPRAAPREALPDAQAAMRTMLNRGLLLDTAGGVEVDRERFAALEPQTCIELHQALTDDDEAHAAARILTFAACAQMPEVSRRHFADAVGAVLPKGVVTERVYRGDFVNLMYFHDDGPIYVEALRRYAAILEDAEMVSALRAFDALLVDDGADGDWRIRVREKLGHYDADVLLAMRDAVDDAILGHRRYLREELAELAAANRSAD